MIGADGAGRAPILDEEPAAPVRADVVEGDNLALVVVQQKLARGPVKAHEIARLRQFAAVRHQVPVVPDQGVDLDRHGQRLLAGWA